MDASQIVLTAEGRQKLVEELAWREGDYAKEIVEDIKEARAFGDLSENSEYDAAKDKQAQNAARIAEIQAILANAQVAATTGDLTVSIGSTVSLIDPNGEVMEVTLGRYHRDQLARAQDFQRVSGRSRHHWSRRGRLRRGRYAFRQDSRLHHRQDRTLDHGPA